MTFQNFPDAENEDSYKCCFTSPAFSIQISLLWNHFWSMQIHYVCWGGLKMSQLESASIFLLSYIFVLFSLKATLIVWSEGDNDLALSFQEKEGCDEIWEKICQVICFDPLGDNQRLW